MSEKRALCVIVGVGPKNGASFARRFAAEGYRVALLSRSASTAEELVVELGAERASAYACDVMDNTRVLQVFEQIHTELGPPSVLVWNVGSAAWGTLEQVDAAGFERGFQTHVIGASVAIKALLPAMRARGEGQIVFIGATASLRGKPMTTAFAAAKAAQRSFAQSLARQLGPEGIHVSLVIIDGVISRDASEDEPHLHPDHIAESVYVLTQQPRTAWTFQLDVRAFNEPW